MNIFLTRHTQTNFNLLHLCNSNPAVDVHLTELGKKQAEDLGEKLKLEKIERIYVSELPRTKETAEIINRHHQAPISVEPRLNDLKSGFEGQEVNVWLDAVTATADAFTAKFNEGESLQDISLRVKSFLDDLKKEPYESVLIVSHGLITQTIYSYFTGKSQAASLDYRLKQGEVDTFTL